MRDLAFQLKNAADPTGLIKSLRLKLVAVSNERGSQKYKNLEILNRIFDQTACLQEYKNFDTRCYLSSVLVD